MNATQARSTVVEVDHVEAEYGMLETVAIIEHAKHGRLLIREGFGGIDTLEGGAIRWKHGLVAKLQPDDTLKSLRKAGWNTEMSLYTAVSADYDSTRPVQLWSGFVIEKIAEAAGL